MRSKPWTFDIRPVMIEGNEDGWMDGWMDRSIDRKEEQTDERTARRSSRSLTPTIASCFGLCLDAEAWLHSATKAVEVLRGRFGTFSVHDR
jgi:hypothetical protein